MSLSDDIAACTSPGVAERPYVPGHRYRAFVVHETKPGPIVLAIAHAEGDLRVVDLIRENITIQNAGPIIKRYGIAKVTGAVSDGDGLDLAHAVCGVINLVSDDIERSQA